MRILLPLILLSACSGQSDAQRGEVIACALDGAAAFAEDCRLQRQGTEMLVVRPDGGFRRLGEVDGEMVALDGAEAAQVEQIEGGLVEVTLAGDRYRFKPTGVVR